MKAENSKGFMLELLDGKYTVFFNWSKDGQFEAKRYNMNWRDLTGDKLMLALCQEILASTNRPNILENQLEKLFEAEMREIVEEYPELIHGAQTMTAANRVIEIVTDRVCRIADNRKWAHIEQVNKDHFGG